MDRYEEYKDSGVDWIGEIPAGWEVVNLGSLAKPRKNINKDGMVENVLSLSYGKIKRRVLDDGGLLPESFNTYNIIEAGDTVLRLTDLQNDQRSLRVGLCCERGVITAAYESLAPQNVAPGYLYYCLAAFDYWRGFYGLAGGVRQGLNYASIRNLRFLLPPVQEQRAVSDYLDCKTAEIDSLVEDCEREVELLQEYRKAVISEAVTKGLDPNVSMKDSGIDWIDEIPEEWEVNKVKFAYINRDSERVPVEASKRDQSAEVLYPYYGASGVVDFISDFIFDEPLLLIGEDGANLRLRNLPLVYVAKGRYWVNNHAHILQPTEMIDYRYSFYQLELVDLENYLTGSTQPKLTAENLGLIPIAIPSMREQQGIAAYLDAKTAEIDSLIADYQAMADKLREYRKSLISEAVTGKFKVPGVA